LRAGIFGSAAAEQNRIPATPSYGSAMGWVDAKPIVTSKILFRLFSAELGTSDTFIDFPIFDTYRIKKKGSKYRTLKVSEDRISGHQISTFDSTILSDTEKNIVTKKRESPRNQDLGIKS
jgi:hypothetical protein